MKAVYKDWTIESKYFGNKCWDVGNSSVENWNNHRVVITNNNSGKWCAFEYWESTIDREIKTEGQLMFAFYCFLSDVLAGEMDYDEFCNEFGYDIWDRLSRKIWNACTRAASKFERVFPDVDLYSFIDELREEYEL